jgi:predicted MFS family arabinose efflux permease
MAGGARRVGADDCGHSGSALAWNYWALLVCRLVNGIGVAMIPPNSMAAIADHFSPAQRGTPISILISVSFFGVAIGTPAVAYLVELGGWRLPFYVVGVLLVMVWGLQWYWFPQRTQVARSLSFFEHFKEAGRSVDLWYVLVANFFYQTAALGIFVYLVAFLIRTYGMKQGDTPLPLAVVGIGAMLGSLIGGYVAGRRYRLTWAAFALLLGGACVGAALTISLSPWTAVILCCAGALLLTIFEPVTWALAAEFAGEARATANGLLATSNQLGIYWGSVGRRDHPRPGRFPTGRALLHGCCCCRLCDRDGAQFTDSPAPSASGESSVNEPTPRVSGWVNPAEIIRAASSACAGRCRNRLQRAHPGRGQERRALRSYHE